MLEQLKNLAALAGFGHPSRPLLGVDISPSSVKILQLAGTGTACRLQNYVIRPLPVNAIVERNISDIKAVGETIAAAVELLKPSIKGAAVAVSGSAVITRTIEMNAALTDAEMEQQILLEADQYIPYALDEVSIDFQRQQCSAHNPESVKVLLAACRRENVDSRVNALEIAGLEAKVVGIEACAIECAYSLIAAQASPDAAIDREQLVAIVDIGSMMTSFHVLLQGRIIYTREQVFGGNALTEAVQHRFGLPAADAAIAIRQGDLPAAWQPDILTPFKQNVVQQISQTLQFFFSASHYNEVDRILLAGGVAAIEGLAEFAEQGLGVPVTIANPFIAMQSSSRLNQAVLHNDAPALLIAAGLAMGGGWQ